MNATTTHSLELVHDIEHFLYQEAALADEHAYNDWLALWTPELLYWVPCNADNIDPTKKVSLIFDDRPRLEERLFRLGTKHAHSQNPRSRLSRIVGNVRLHNFDPATGGEVSSRFNLTECAPTASPCGWTPAPCARTPQRHLANAREAGLSGQQ